MIHPTAKMSEHVNRKCRLGRQFYNFRPLLALHRPCTLELPTSSTIDK